jgi:hypothetical protein
MPDKRGMSTFKLSIELGNDAIQTPDDVATVLRVIADLAWWSPWESTESGCIQDVNGNPVGAWEWEVSA